MMGHKPSAYHPGRLVRAMHVLSTFWAALYNLQKVVTSDGADPVVGGSPGSSPCSKSTRMARAMVQVPVGHEIVG